jgi:hypothetical protein
MISITLSLVEAEEARAPRIMRKETVEAIVLWFCEVVAE